MSTALEASQSITFFYLEGGVTLPKIDKTFSGPLRIINVKDKLIGSAVNEILRYGQTDRYIDILLLLFEDEGQHPSNLDSNT